METLIDQLTSRHIAKLLTRLGSTIAPVVESEIKKEFRFLADDIKSDVLNMEIRNNDNTQEKNYNGNI